MLKASKHTEPKAMAGAIAGSIESVHYAEVMAVGAGALNQAMKGMIIARGYFAPRGIELYAVPSFEVVNIEGQQMTAIKLKIRAD